MAGHSGQVWDDCRTMKIIHINAGRDNIGDALSAKAIHFALKQRSVENESKSYVIREVIKNPGVLRLAIDDCVIIGGGGLLGHCPSFDRFWNVYLRMYKKFPHKTVLWGIGINEHYDAQVFSKTTLKSILSTANLIGVRGPLTHLACSQFAPKKTQLVPCPTLMLSEVIQEFPKDIDMLFVKHKDFDSKLSLPHITVDNFPDLNGRIDYLSAIQRARVVLSCSYHGVYWGFLNHCRVIPVSFSTRFDDLNALLGIVPLKMRLVELRDDKVVRDRIEVAKHFDYDYGKVSGFMNMNRGFTDSVVRILQ